MLETKTDEQLVEAAQNDNADAFGAIVKRWERKIFALCFGILQREDDARDATQETFISAYRNLKNFRGDAKVSSWLHRIAVNQCLTKKRRAKVRGESSLEAENGVEELSVFASPHASPARQTESKQKILLIRRAVQALPNELKEIVVMKEFEEMTFQEIAETLEMPLSTVKSRLYTALKQLKMKLEKMSLEVV